MFDRSPVAVATELEHTQLPKLDDAGVVDYRDGVVVLRDDTAQTLLEGILTADRGQRLKPMAVSTAGIAPEITTRAAYRAEQERSLTEAILAAVADHRGADLRWADSDRYDELDPESLNTLFQSKSTAETSVTLRTATVRVALWEDDGVAIRVTDARDSPMLAAPQTVCGRH
ncbi:hypothetical protein C495_05813 [Natronorubrum sulfidifaciens JCM 14089]|uniref:Halobacterial output domain-containing protein n=1 Tax=Natronorubrum sulfidifaciens JCM 14089 TaxID=1230460 RepID=L9WAW5_9EURY|nr:hypothetical protein C495_05813 [Natronorubrum sulfidifaciens JCM 14089]